MSEFKFEAIYDILKNRISEVINSEEINLANISVEKLEELDKYILDITEKFDMYIKKEFDKESYNIIKNTYSPYSKIEDEIFKIRYKIKDIIEELKEYNRGETTEKYTINNLKILFSDIFNLIEHIPTYMNKTEEYNQKLSKRFKDTKIKKIKIRMILSLVPIYLAILISLILPLSILHPNKKKKNQNNL